jgi:hypothetical protein
VRQHRRQRGGSGISESGVSAAKSTARGIIMGGGGMAYENPWRVSVDKR